jgi:hypothetical protein
MEEEEARLRRDRELDLVGQLEPAAPFERLLGQEDPDEPLELLSIRVVELGEVGDVLREDGALGRSERRFAEQGAPAVLEEVEHRT